MNRILPMLLLVACTGGDSDSDTPDTSDLRTLETCGSALASDTPAFFARFACVTTTVTGTGVDVHTVDLPPYASPYYPLSDANWTEFDDRGGDWHQNPNFLAQQDVTLSIPDAPVSKGLTVTSDLVDGEANTSDEEYALGPAGMALNGVLLFNATAAPGDDIADEAFTFDRYEGHPAPSGEYHYHGASPGPLEVLAAAGDTTLELYGIMCDGTVILGCTELDGTAHGTDLDAQGGHVHDLVNAGGATEFADRYHTHVCSSGHGYTPEIQYYTTCTR
jgi:hypothetical protein